MDHDIIRDNAGADLGSIVASPGAWIGCGTFQAFAPLRAGRDDRKPLGVFHTRRAALASVVMLTPLSRLTPAVAREAGRS